MTSLSTVSTPFDILAPSDLSAFIVPSYPVEWETKKVVAVSQSDRGVRQVVAKSRAFRNYSLDFRGRKQAEYEGFEPIWGTLYPSGSFYWINPVVDANGLFGFDSTLSWVPARKQSIDYSVRVKARTPIAIVVPESSVMPFKPSYKTEGKPTREVAVTDALDQSRSAVGLSSQKRLFNLTFTSRSLAQTLEMEQFWDYHYPGRPVTYTDPVLNISGQFWIDSDFKARVRGVNLVDYSFAIREV